MTLAAHVTYAMVKPRLDDEVERIKEALTGCTPEALIVLQARIAALRQVDQWFARMPTDTQIFDQAV